MDVAIAQNLSARVEAALKQVLGSETDDFDGPDFDAVDYINAHFPDERSLDGIDKQIAAMELEIGELDESILESVRAQSTAGREAARDIADAKDSIGDLAGKILEIKRKAEVSEKMVQEICHDIRQLDIAKKHLTNTMLTLTRLKTLASAVDQLRGHTARRSYGEAAPLLEAAVNLFLYFGEYRDVPKVSELANGLEKIREDLREAVSEDFDILVDCATPDNMAVLEAEAEMGKGKILRIDLSAAANDGDGDGNTSLGPRALTEDNIQTLTSACEVIDALGPAIRRSTVKAFNRKQLKPYSNVFHRGSQYGDALDGVEKRYAWFRRSLRDVEARYGRILPAHWRVLHRLCIDFCEATRVEIDRILSQYDPPSDAPADALLKALMKTLAFEKEMSKRFEKANEGGAGAGGTGIEALGTLSMAGGGEGGAAYDESAPLYNAKGELVEPTTAEGIRLKYKRKKEWEERAATDAARAAQRHEKRQWWASLAGMAPPASGGGANKDADDLTSFPKIAEPGRGLISEVFTPYMAAYVRFERDNIDSGVKSSLQEDFASNGAPITNANVQQTSVLRSSMRLFNESRNSIQRCTQLNTGATLFALYKEVKESFATYAAELEARMVKPIPVQPGALPGDTYEVPEDRVTIVIDTLCLIVSTAEYCGETVPALVENIKKVLDESYRTHVAMEDTQETFFNLQGTALRTLSGVVACLLDGALLKLSRNSWANVAEVGDQSAYVSDITRVLRAVMPRVRTRVGDAAYRNFCDKFGRAFMARYQSAIFRCKRIGETGAQQLLLDAQAIRIGLLSAPYARERGGANATGGGEEEVTTDIDPSVVLPPVYAKFVQREVPRVEMLLKIIACPKERFGETIKALWPEVTTQELTRVMDLKALTKKEQTDVQVQLGLIKAPAPSTSALGTLNIGIGGALAGLGGGSSSAASSANASAGAPAPAPATAASSTFSNMKNRVTANLFSGKRK